MRTAQKEQRSDTMTIEEMRELSTSSASVDGLLLDAGIIVMNPDIGRLRSGDFQGAIAQREQLVDPIARCSLEGQPERLGWARGGNRVRVRGHFFRVQTDVLYTKADQLTRYLSENPEWNITEWSGPDGTIVYREHSPGIPAIQSIMLAVTRAGTPKVSWACVLSPVRMKVKDLQFADKNEGCIPVTFWGLGSIYEPA
jgi:hypothetical protein